MSLIDEMSRLVLADPNVTAREIARQLGYAEEKSVYYWLQKAGFSGIRDFKKSVLRRVLTSPPRAEPGVARDAGEPAISLYTDTDAKTARTTLMDHIDSHLGRDSFGILLTHADFRPLASAGDVLIVDPDAPSFQGDLMWASVRGQMLLVRQYGMPDTSLLYVDAGQPGSIILPDFVSGKVVFIVRKHA